MFGIDYRKRILAILDRAKSDGTFVNSIYVFKAKWKRGKIHTIEEKSFDVEGPEDSGSVDFIEYGVAKAKEPGYYFETTEEERLLKTSRCFCKKLYKHLKRSSLNK